VKILGIDPGAARVGWGVVEAVNRGGPRALALGCITTEKDTPHELRLQRIYESVNRLLNKHHPDVMAIEELFFGKNVTNALMVAQARGVIMLTASQRGIPVISYAPRTVKLAVCGTGSADKKQMQRMITLLLHLPKAPNPDDVADALAVALTHAYTKRFGEKRT
jgi:crossover junction endodeoxyribonuclease RuvC